MRRVLKQLALGVAKGVVLPLFVMWIVYHRLTKRDRLFVTFSQLLGLLPGYVGVLLRRGFYCLALDRCGQDVTVGFETYFSHHRVSLGQGIYIGARCTIGMVHVGDGTLIGSNVDILSGRNQHPRDERGRLLGSDRGVFRQVRIGSNSWIGNSAVVLADIGNDCTVGAGSVVVHEVKDGSTVVGNPARSRAGPA